MDADTKLRELLAVGEHFKAQAQAGKRIDPEGVRALRLAMLAYCRLDALADTLTTAQANRLMQAGRLLRPALTALASLEGIDAEQLMAQATKGDSAAWSKWAALAMIEGEPAKADGEAQADGRGSTLFDACQQFMRALSDIERAVTKTYFANTPLRVGERASVAAIAGRVDRWGRPLLAFAKECEGENGITRKHFEDIIMAMLMAKAWESTVCSGEPMRRHPKVLPRYQREIAAALKSARKLQSVGAALEGLKASATPTKAATPAAPIAPNAKRRWTQAEVDAELRTIRRESGYRTIREAVEAGKPGAKKQAPKLYGRNALAKRIGCADGAVSASPEWPKIADELRIPRPSGKRGPSRMRIGAAIAQERAAVDDGDTTGADVERRETLRIIRAALKGNELEAVERRLEAGDTTDEDARAIADAISGRHAD
ncbi:MAG: hypothetical protein K8T25_17655 [Planctomycetia bacterium]|nr:hypothetical protein [Planctomycetia bacterium]